MRCCYCATVQSVDPVSEYEDNIDRLLHSDSYDVVISSAKYVCMSVCMSVCVGVCLCMCMCVYVVVIAAKPSQSSLRDDEFQFLQ